MESLLTFFSCVLWSFIEFNIWFRLRRFLSENLTILALCSHQHKDPEDVLDVKEVEELFLSMQRWSW